MSLPSEAPTFESTGKPVAFPRRIRMQYGRHGPLRFISHLDLVKVIERAIRRTTIKAAYTEGFHPRLRLSFASALPVGAESSGEWMDLDLHAADPTTAEQIQTLMNSTLPPGLAVLAAREIRFPCKSLGGIISMSVWRLTSPHLHDAVHRIEAVLSASTLSVVRRSQRRDVRPFIERIEMMETPPELSAIRAWLRIEAAGSVKPEELLTVMGYPLEQRQEVRACREALLWNSPAGWADPWGDTGM